MQSMLVYVQHDAMINKLFTRILNIVIEISN